ncbi:3643_t:CDS:2 [Scutellospora calospora]|uniref:3643_t:CDS:1 n=1 Tax=Scutellospora calospora TaxID=85575 RepID=A0ACA9L4X0_9GLOM|nr:3643_t:CDS:2 [Scutellospora calospora]
MVHKKKRTHTSNQSTNTSDREGITQSISESETDRSEQNSDIEDNPPSKTNELLALLKRLKTLEKLQATNDKNDSSSSGMESTSDEDSIALPIEKPSETMYINISKFLKIDKPIYNSYRNVPEYRRISEKEKNEIIKRRKNPMFPLTVCDWAIRQMMRGIINNKCNTEKRKMNGHSSHNSKKNNKDPSTETHETLEEFISSLGTSSIEVTRTSSPVRSTSNISTTSTSRSPLTTLQQSNADETQDVSLNYTIEALETPN